MVFYFTATGNCLYVARELDEELVSISHESLGRNYAAESIGVVCPIYAHEVPPHIKEFLQAATFDTKYFYMVLTYGFCQGGATVRIKEFMEGQGKRLDYVNVLKMVDNALPAFDIEEELRIDPDKKVDEHLAAIKEDIAKRRPFIAQPTAWDIEFHEQLLQAPFTLDPEKDFRAKSAEMYQITDSCIGCGICSKVCPRGCIKIEDKRAHQNMKRCVACLACIHACPQKAIQFTFPEKNPHARYRNPHVSLKDIIAANCQT